LDDVTVFFATVFVVLAVAINVATAVFVVPMEQV
jgi:hypothetical protein